MANFVRSLILITGYVILFCEVSGATLVAYYLYLTWRA